MSDNQSTLDALTETETLPGHIMSIENAIQNLADAINNLATSGVSLPAELKQTVSAEEKAPAKAEEKAPAKKAPAKKAPAKKAPAKKAEAAVSVDDLVAMAKKILPADLDADERKERHGQIKPKLEELGAAKITEVPEESRGEMLTFMSELYDSLNGETEGDDDLV